MWKENKIFKEDLDYCINAPFIPWNEFTGKTFFITGATGLIGYTLTSAILYHSLTKNSGIKVVALVRDEEKAKKQFKDLLADNVSLEFVKGTVESFPNNIENIDYIIHGACPTASAFFSEYPVETIQTIVNGTSNILNLAKEKEVKSVVYLSSMEVYGEVLSREKLSESDLGKIDLTSSRSSYPEAKRLSENLCACFEQEFSVPVKIARLAQTFGPGVKYEDNRVFAYMMRCALENKNIELKTSGEKENPYLYTMDAVTAILTLLARGEDGKSYNVANENTYCSVKEMGQIVFDTFKKPDLKVLTNVGNNSTSRLYPPPVTNESECIRTNEIAMEDEVRPSRNVSENGSNSMFRPNGYLNLSTVSLRNLLWKPKTDLSEEYRRMVESLE